MNTITSRNWSALENVLTPEEAIIEVFGGGFLIPAAPYPITNKHHHRMQVTEATIHVQDNEVIELSVAGSRALLEDLAGMWLEREWDSLTPIHEFVEGCFT